MATSRGLVPVEMVAVTVSAPATPWSPMVRIDDTSATNAMEIDTTRAVLPRVQWSLIIKSPMAKIPATPQECLLREEYTKQLDHECPGWLLSERVLNIDNYDWCQWVVLLRPPDQESEGDATEGARWWRDASS